MQVKSEDDKTVLALPFLSGTTSNKNEQKKREKMCLYLSNVLLFLDNSFYIKNLTHVNNIDCLA